MLRYLCRLAFAWIFGVVGFAASICLGGWCGAALAKIFKSAVGGQTFGMILGAVFGGFIHIRIFNKLESQFFPPAKIVHAEECLDSRVIHGEVSQEQVQVEYDGCVYCLSNPAMPGLYKIGYTKRCPHQRAFDLYKGRNGTGTGVPMPFKVEFYFKCMEAYKTEQLLHKKLAPYRLNTHREFFEIDLQELERVFSDNIPEPCECVGIAPHL
ncbi:GIY-YIG nuclease family protein [Maridesulfovibrio sp.]|uniref:GIY-YIG nuclease family protein n=1 Tax=Maridesulfovibrio sp. TaxID=2795000 RepID=UPI0029CA7EA4|nr:GIY-YIG nuclease family protein [Maridesulfovibrio sp.]